MAAYEVGKRHDESAQMQVSTEVAGSVWKVEKQVGDPVSAGDTIMIIESMKMEIPVESPSAGKVGAILVAEGDQVTEGQAVVDIQS